MSSLIASAFLLAIERGVYVFIWHYPDRFGQWCLHPVVRSIGAPVDVVRALFVVFKLIQGTVFAGWFWIHGDGRVGVTDHPGAAMTALFLVAVGQVLNLGVFARLGATGVFYGNRFGHPLPWVRAFPFSVVSHPQYVGTVLSIWGLFMLVRFPHPDWIVLPLLETIYYGAGSYLESDRT